MAEVATGELGFPPSFPHSVRRANIGFCSVSELLFQPERRHTGSGAAKLGGAAEGGSLVHNKEYTTKKKKSTIK